jgi:hypothetical protein
MSDFDLPSRLIMLAMLFASSPSWAGEATINGGASAEYSHDDNIRVTPNNQIALTGLKAKGNVEMGYATSRFNSSANIELGVDRYNDVDFDSDDPLLGQPKTSDFDSDNYDVSVSLVYAFERHKLSIIGGTSRDSTLNTQFLDTGLGGLRQIDGASDRDTNMVQPSWQWELTERQALNTVLSWQEVDFESPLYTNYDYISAQTTWFYVLSERMRIQAQPLYSRYKNEAAFPIESETLGLEAGVIWMINEKWQLDALIGGSRISTDYGGAGYFIFNPDTFQIEFVELEDSKGNGFTGSGELKFTEEQYGLSASFGSRLTPSGNGYLQKLHDVGLKFYWNPLERLRVNFDLTAGLTDSSSSDLENKREFAAAGIRLAYQFNKDWWLSSRYRYREQEYERSNLGKGDGNLVSVSISYKLPKEIL